MFTRMKGVWGAASDDGYTVVRTGSPISGFTIKYAESDGRSVIWPIENSAPGSKNRIDPNQIESWLPPHEKETLNKEKKTQVAERICKAMQFLGDGFEVAEFKHGTY
jgi:hypothetical protein